MKKLEKLLVANRGEIAVRIMHGARKMGIKSVAVYSDADIDAVHVNEADESVRIGPAPVSESYLLIDEIIKAALASGADAIHPGYGLLSENAQFAESVIKAGLIFVGPSSAAILQMADKAEAKRLMLSAGVSCIPGYEGEDQSDERFFVAAKEIGYPIMIKAAAGGGGRGMRLSHDPGDLEELLFAARAEALSAFGSDVLILEKALLDARHVEVQIFGDSFGNIVSLGERDCSTQRRHQKIIEESPCPAISAEMRSELGVAAIEAAKAVSYEGAGTVEFLVDSNGYYFLEMNTRLQVEHPVTEMVTGLDLVELQLRVAQGEPLGIDQSDVAISGHAIEVRLCAEDPINNFLPSVGKVVRWAIPNDSFVRVDCGIEEGTTVSPFYDSLLAKIIVHGSTREEARTRLQTALGDTILFGFPTNRDFLINILGNEVFASGAANTSFIKEVYGEEELTMDISRGVLFALGAVVYHVLECRRAQSVALGVGSELIDWSSDAAASFAREYRLGGHEARVLVKPIGNRSYNTKVGDEEFVVRIHDGGDSHFDMEIDGLMEKVSYAHRSNFSLHLATTKATFDIEEVSSQGRDLLAGANSGSVLAPMHGIVRDIIVREGDSVDKGDKLASLEAMKMQHEILAPVPGKIVQLEAHENSQVSANDLLLEIEPAQDSDT